MAIGRTWQESIQKAIRQVDPQYNGFQGDKFDDLDDALRNPTGAAFLIPHSRMQSLTKFQRSPLACRWPSVDERKIYR